MMGRTHFLAGISSLWLLYLIPSGISPLAIAELPSATASANLGVLSALAILGALLPDLDAHDSLLKRLTIGAGVAPFVLPAMALHKAFGHRGMLHSAVGLGVVSGLIALPVEIWLGWQPAAALLLGYGSHLMLDACTKSGIPFLFPDRTRRFLLPRPLRITTGSPGEEVVLAVFALLSLALLLRALGLMSR